MNDEAELEPPAGMPAGFVVSEKTIEAMRNGLRLLAKSVEKEMAALSAGLSGISAAVSAASDGLRGIAAAVRVDTEKLAAGVRAVSRRFLGRLIARNAPEPKSGAELASLFHDERPLTLARLVALRQSERITPANLRRFLLLVAQPNSPNFPVEFPFPTGLRAFV